jgi:hypothetical protein
VTAGSLTIVGTGISIGGHLTPEARAAFERAEEAWYLVGDPVATALLEEINPRARSLHDLYDPGLPRLETYEAMVERLLASVRAGRQVCAAFYGHPGVFVYPSQKAIERARAEGYDATMLPGIGSLDCLWSDLGIDPAADGCQIYHATDFVLEARVPDTAATLVLLQINVIGQAGYVEEPDWSRLPVLVDYLLRFDPPGHETLGYEASPFPLTSPLVERAPISGLADAKLSPGMTLVVPPASRREADPELARLLEVDAGA